jgi:antitoxin component YwqK of YwqJK toxin-antitoxin module
MKTHIYLVSLLFCAQLCFSQKNGPYEKHYDSGQLKISGQYKNKKRVGEWKEYYENGRLRKIYSYAKGKRNREGKTFYKEGNLKSETKKLGDSKFESKGYFENGTLFYERISPDGLYKEYYKSAELKIESTYDEGEMSGVWRQFSKSGNVEWEVAYTSGYKHGVYKQYYPNGKIKLEGNHKLSKKDGKEIHYDEAGNQMDELKYKKGKLIKSKNRISEEVKVPDGMIEHVPIYPECEKVFGNKARKKCMSIKITEFISKNYDTDIAKKYGIPSNQKIKIYVIFKIDKKGNVVGVKARSPHPKFTEEAVRVVKMLPKLKSGVQRGKPVVVPFSLPIVFNIPSKEGYNKN